MSTTTTPPITTANAAITAATDPTSLVGNLKTAAANGASEVPQIVTAIMTAFPQVAAQQATFSKTPIGAALGTLVGGVAAHYGLDWGQATDEAVAMAGTVLGGYITHYIQSWAAARKVAA